MNHVFSGFLKGRQLFVILMAVVSIVGVGYGIRSLSAAQSVAYSNDFTDSSSIASWVSYGKHAKEWKVKDGQLVSPSSEDKSQGIKGTDTPVLSDFEAQFTIRFRNEDSEGGLLFRLQPDGSGYLLKLDPEDNRWKLSIVNARANDETLMKGKTRIGKKQSYDVNVIVQNNHLILTLSGQAVAEFDLPSRFPSGNFGFWTEDGKVLFDNLEILKENVVVTPKPTVTHVPLASSLLSNGSGVPLYRFTVAANPAGDVGLYKFSFILNTSTATVTNMKLYEDPDGFSTDLTSNGARNITETFIPASGNPLNNGLYGIDVLFDTGIDGVAFGGEYRIIAASGIKTYELRGDVAGATTGSRVETKLLSDPVADFVGYKSAIEVDNGSNDNFIWSDLHFGNSSSTATNTAEWMNGFEVPGSDSIGSQVLAK